MKTFFGSLYHVFYTANKVHIIWCAAILLTMLLLTILHHQWRDDTKKLKIWRFLCLIPLLTVIVHFVIYAASFPMLAGYYLLLYLIGILALLPILFAKRKIGYPIIAFLVGVLSVLLGFYFSATSPNVGNYANMSYTDSFRAMVQDMDKKYVLKEWKDVDFQELESKYLPLVEIAEQEQDPAKFADAVTQFCNEIHDGHVYTNSDYDFEQYTSETKPHEYGLAMVQLDNGDVIAVCTTKEVQALGIEDGTVITEWNGKPILQAVAEDVPDQGLPVSSNADRIGLLYLSGIGGDTIKVAFIDNSGTEQTVTLSSLDHFHTFREAFFAFSQRPVLDSQEAVDVYFASNFSARMLNDKCGYLILNAEGTDNELHDTLGYLVIDLRNNMGGFDEIGCALCDLLTTENYYGQGLGIRKNGEYTCVSDHGIYGDGEFADLQVVALTNQDCASAGDGTSLYLSRLPNVTLAGITDPNGCNQETGGMCVLTDGIVTVGYPVGLILNEDCEPNVDTRSDRISRNPVEVRIPFDHDAAMKIFRDKEDYELDWAIQYLEQNAEK